MYNWEVTGDTCFYCKREVKHYRSQKGVKTPPDNKTQDHLIPKSKGGQSTVDNLVIACGTCNVEKGSLTGEEYLQVLAFRRGEMDSTGYEKDKCHFCGKRNAGHARAEDSKPQGPFYDACEACARKPYPQPKQFEQEKTA